MATINHKKYDEATETFKDFYVYDGKETLIFKVDGEDGNVGIGTASPQGDLDIKGATNVVVYLRNSSNGDTGTDGLLLGNVGGIPDSYQIWNYENGFLRFGTNATEQMRITSAGNVGIGTTSPSDKLHIEADNGGAIRLERNDPTINNGNRIGGINFAGNESGTSLIGATIEAVAAENWVSPTSFGSDIVFYQATTGTSAYAERFRFRGNGGLTFNGDTAAANALDDYEEGTWTPDFQIGGTTTGITYTVREGRYTKIGRVVTANCYIVLSSKGTSTGTARLYGLPFTIPNANNAYSPCAFYNDGGINYTGQFQAFGNKNSTSIVFGYVIEGGTVYGMTDINFANNSSWMLSITYSV